MSPLSRGDFYFHVFYEAIGNRFRSNRWFFLDELVICRDQTIHKTAFMKKLLLATLAFVFCVASNAQSAYTQIKLDAQKDYKSAEKDVLKAANYLFSTKYDEDDLERLYATEFVMKWMAGTPDYTFEINEKFSKAFAEDPELLNLYMSALAKLAIEKSDKAKDTRYLGLNAVKMVLDYTGKTTNNLRQTTELKKMSAALKKGELEKYLGI